MAEAGALSRKGEPRDEEELGLLRSMLSQGAPLSQCARTLQRPRAEVEGRLWGTSAGTAGACRGATAPVRRGRHFWSEADDRAVASAIREDGTLPIGAAEEMAKKIGTSRASVQRRASFLRARGDAREVSCHRCPRTGAGALAAATEPPRGPHRGAWTPARDRLLVPVVLGEAPRGWSAELARGIGVSPSAVCQRAKRMRADAVAAAKGASRWKGTLAEVMTQSERERMRKLVQRDGL